MSRRKKKKLEQNPYILGPGRWAALCLALVLSTLVFGPNSSDDQELLASKDTKWQKMGESITRMALEYEGHVGVYIKDLKTGKVFEINSDRPFVSASLIKVPIMAATFKAIAEDRLSLDSSMKLRNRFKRGGSGKLKRTGSGAVVPISKLLYMMMTESDNTATAMLIHRLGYGYLNRSFEEFGLRKTRINRRGMSLSSYLDPSKDNYTTAREMGIILEKMYRHELVSNGFSDLMLEIMKGADKKTRLGRYLPEQWVLARKTGLLRKNCHDVGIVFTADRDYIVCVLTGSNQTYRKAKGLIATVGREAYEYFGRSS